MNIITHVSPDLDAIGAVWLLQRFGGLESADVRFVNTGNPPADLLEAAIAVCDTGREYDPRRLRFDHHHLPGAEANATCATQQVYHWLIIARPNTDWSYLGPIVDLIYAGDTGKPEANESRRRGIHAQHSALKARGASDYVLLNDGYAMLDLLAEHAKARQEAADTLSAHLVYRSADGLLVALKDAPAHASSAAFEAGARLVVFQHTDLMIPTHAIGVWRSGEWQQPHVGQLVAAVIADPSLPADTLDELSIWYRHEAGFFAGRGTAKAPNATPIVADVVDIATALDSVWVR